MKKRILNCWNLMLFEFLDIFVSLPWEQWDWWVKSEYHDQELLTCCSSDLWNNKHELYHQQQQIHNQIINTQSYNGISPLQASAVYWVKYELVTVACKSTTCNNQWNLQYFEMLSLLESSMFNFLQTSVGQGEGGQIWNICENSAVQSWYLNKHQETSHFSY